MSSVLETAVGASESTRSVVREKEGKREKEREREMEIDREREREAPVLNFGANKGGIRVDTQRRGRATKAPNHSSRDTVSIDTPTGIRHTNAQIRHVFLQTKKLCV